MAGRSGFVALLFAGLGLSGCLGGGDAVSASDIFTAETGAIRGRAIDQELYPVAGVQVTLHKAGNPDPLSSTTTGPDAFYEFPLLPPGDYMLVAEHPAYNPVEVTTKVAAGHVTTVGLALERLPVDEPYVQVLAWVGFMGCGLSIGVTPMNCAPAAREAGLPVSSNETNIWSIPDGFQAVVVEAFWDGSDEASLWTYNFTGEEEYRRQNDNRTFQYNLDRAWGGSPLKIVMLAGQEAENITGALSTVYHPVADGTAFEMRVVVFWHGYYGSLLWPMDPVCQQLTYPRCAGVGATLDFRFESWASIFVHGLKEDLATYSILPDA